MRHHSFTRDRVTPRGDACDAPATPTALPAASGAEAAPARRFPAQKGVGQSSGRTAAATGAAALATLLALGQPSASAGGGCAGAIGSCVLPHATPGCDDTDCCVMVCSISMSCCDVAWDDFCVEVADSTCEGYCGAEASGSCFEPHSNPACDTSECCDLVCALDGFCCSESWDTNCAVLASLQCEQIGGECGPGATGDCFEPHPSGACNDIACCKAVCAIDPECCATAWDFICVFLAEQACAPCSVECPEGGVEENEICGLSSNDPCVAPTGGAMAQTITCGTTLCGRVIDDGPGGAAVDIDVYRIVLTDPDGDGLVQFKLEFRAEFNGFAALVPAASCGTLTSSVAVATSVQCVSGFIDQCVAPGEWRLVVAPGDFPTPGSPGQDVTCGFNDRYTLQTQCLQGCGPACNVGAGDCFVPHTNPGCADLACCAAVCTGDPLCCESGWDVQCAFAAVALCGGAPPENDTCATCIEVTEGDYAFTTIGANSGDPLLPPICDEGNGLAFDHDIWFCYTPTCSAPITVETCDAASFDTRIAVYSGECDALSLVGCGDDDLLCLQIDTSRVEFQSVCGQTYRIRVGGFDGAAGVGTLTISCGFGVQCPPNCPADLNGDGMVDGADLGILLADWENDTPADLNGDGFVGGADLGLLLSAWGEC